MSTQPHIACPKCKYDLHGLFIGDDVTCPECGSTWLHASLIQPPQRWRFKWRFAALAVAPPFGLPLFAVLGNGPSPIIVIWWPVCLLCVLVGAWFLASGGRSIREAGLAFVGRFILIATLAFCLDFVMAAAIALAMDGGHIKM